MFSSTKIFFRAYLLFLQVLSVSWKPCGPLYCAILEVPMNHLDPNSRKIEIALNLYRPNNRAKKTILVNPGGPSGSGIDFVIKMGQKLSGMFNDDLNIVGFDPRGYGKSTRIRCATMTQFQGYSDALWSFEVLFLPKNSRSAQQIYWDTGHKLNAEICAENTGELLAFMSSANVARDMEAIRLALNQEKLNFYGISYGTILGLTYANMFPQNVGKMLLDSVINPQHYFGDVFG